LPITTTLELALSVIFTSSTPAVERNRWRIKLQQIKSHIIGTV